MGYYIKKKLKFVDQLNDIFSRKEKIHFLIVLLVALAMALFQAVGIASVLPFMDIVMNPDTIQNNKWILYFYNLFNFKSVNSFILCLGIIILTLIVIGNVISAFAVWLTTSFAWKKNHRLAVSLLEKYLSLPYIYFTGQNTAELGKNILFEVQQLTSHFLLPLLRIITNGVVATIIFAMLFYVNPLMTLVSITVLAILYIVIYLKISKRIKVGGKKVVEFNGYRFKRAAEALGGIKDTKVLGREKYFLSRFSSYSLKFSNLQSWYKVAGQVPRYLMETVAFGGIVALIIVLISVGYAGEEIIPLVGFFAFAGYRLMPTLQDIFNSFTTFRFHRAVLDKIHYDMTRNGLPLLKNDKKYTKPLSFNDKIVLENISFSYNESSTVLKNITLSVKKNTTVAIVGTTGSGKSTLIDIILGLLSPEKGIIKVDDTIINDKNVKNWQAGVGYVQQHIYLSDDTIARNIAFGLPDEEIDMEQVKRVSKIANVNSFIENNLSDGYETVIGERGVRLSGGQRQRLGIARALYHNPEVLIFDEATSALDGMTEKSVLRSIDGISKLKTMIVIAHRLTTVKNCDYIYLLDKGKIVDQGSYEQLMKKNKQFQKMANDKL